MNNYTITRYLKHLFQRWTRGWDDTELYDVGHTIAKFALPRLIEFKNNTTSHPGHMTMEEWRAIIDNIIYMLEVYVHERYWDNDIDWNRITKGSELFGKYFFDLWW